jgi:hypothetical protein
MALDGAVVVVGVLHRPGVAGQVGAQSSSDPRIVAFTHVDGTADQVQRSPLRWIALMVSAGDEVSASLLAGCATTGDVGLCWQADCSPSVTEDSPPRMAHGHNIDNLAGDTFEASVAMQDVVVRGVVQARHQPAAVVRCSASTPACMVPLSARVTAAGLAKYKVDRSSRLRDQVQTGGCK